MSFLDSELHLAYKFGNDPINSFPFPHLYVQDIFSDIFYSQIQKNLPDHNLLTSMPDLYPEELGFEAHKDRYVMDLMREESINKIEKDKQEFWRGLGDNFKNGKLSDLLRNKFQYYLNMRFKLIENVSFLSEIKLINDRKNYASSPHTSHPRKVVSVIFYLPTDLSQKLSGTSIYIPKDLNFIAQNKEYKHYPHEHFHKVITMPFLPNSAFCFIKTNNSFHGVEKLEMEDTDRWTLQFDILLDKDSYLREEEAKIK